MAVAIILDALEMEKEERSRFEMLQIKNRKRFEEMLIFLNSTFQPALILFCI
jgi:hypothetical protein